VFHFLTAAQERLAYKSVMAGAVKRGGCAVIGTFAPDSPEECSGLPVCRYDADGLASEFAGDFLLAGALKAEHPTPGGSMQTFQFAVLRRICARQRRAS
jgi:hypothetical protein